VSDKYRFCMCSFYTRQLTSLLFLRHCWTRCQRSHRLLKVSYLPVNWTSLYIASMFVPFCVVIHLYRSLSHNKCLQAAHSIYLKMLEIFFGALKFSCFYDLNSAEKVIMYYIEMKFEHLKSVNTAVFWNRAS
jgi:hypothetical protein